jgi:excisionase family DNA binding protein
MAKTRIEQAPARRKRGRLLTVDQVAERLGVSVTYVRRRLIFERRLPYIKLGSKVRVGELDLEDFIESKIVTPED